MKLTTPLIGAWMDEEEIAFRHAAEDNLLRAIELGFIPGAKPESITLFPTGTSSVVFKLETSDGPRVVKMCHKQEIILREAAFLKAWSAVGVATPKIFDAHAPDDQFPIAFVVMEYINKPLLNETLSHEEMVNSGVAREMGRTLALMHSVHGQGFGRAFAPDFNRGEFATFSEDMQQVLRRFSPFLLENHIIDQGDLDAVGRASQILEQDLKERSASPSFIHGDFQTHNIFYAKPIIIFDPGTRITHTAVDLGLTALRPLAVSSSFGQKEHEEIVAGYREKTPISEKVLIAGMVLQSIHLLHTWNKRDKPEKAEKLRGIFNNLKNQL